MTFIEFRHSSYLCCVAMPPKGKKRVFTDEEEEKLIANVQKHEILFNPQHGYFKNIVKKDEEWAVAAFIARSACPTIIGLVNLQTLPNTTDYASASNYAEGMLTVVASVCGRVFHPRRPHNLGSSIYFRTALRWP